MKNISIIIPCYNEEEVLPLFYDELNQHLSKDYLFNLIFIDDGSTDKTLLLIKQLSHQDNRIQYISFSRNFGKESAMLAGLKLAKAIKSDAAILIDADLQHPPHLIKDMIVYFEKGYKHVFARQKNRKGGSYLKALCAKAFYHIYALFTGYANMNHGAVDFCLIDSDVIDAFLSIKDHARFTKGIFSWVGFERVCIDFDYKPRKIGATKWSFYGLWKYAMSGLKQFSYMYLFIPTIFILIAFLILLFDIVFGLVRQNINWLVIRIEFFALLILISFRFIIKLLYDVRDQNLNRPHYIIKESNTKEYNDD